MHNKLEKQTYKLDDDDIVCGLLVSIDGMEEQWVVQGDLAIFNVAEWPAI